MPRSHLVLVLIGAIGFSLGVTHAQDVRPDRPYVEGVVVKKNGEPLAGVKYWTAQYRLGIDGEGGFVNYTGFVTVEETEEDGRFVCVYGGAGRKEEAIDIAFLHSDFAPTWLVNANQANGPFTVAMDNGAKLTGTVEDNSDRAPSRRLNPGPLHLQLDVGHKDVGGVLPRIPIQTENDGWFSVRVPTEYWNSYYWLHVAGTTTDLKFEKDKPLPKLVIKVDVNVEKIGPTDDP